MNTPPMRPSSAGSQPADLLALARSQRVMVRLFAASIALVGVKFALPMVLSHDAAMAMSTPMLGVQALLWIALAVMAHRVARASGMSDSTSWVHAGLTLVPLLNLGVVLLLNLRASKILQQAGVPAPLTGVCAKDLARLKPASSCPGCGYSVRGVASGRCPECQRELSARRAA